MQSRQEDAVPSGRNPQKGSTTALPAPAPEAASEPAADATAEFRPSHVLRGRLAAAAGLIAAAFVSLGATLGSSHVGSLWLFMSFLTFQALSWAAAFRLQPSDTQFVQQFDEAIFVASAMLLPAGGVIAVLGMGTAIGLIALR